MICQSLSVSSSNKLFRLLAGAGFAADFGLEEGALVEALLVGLAFAEAFEFAEVGLAVPGFADAAEGATVPLDAAGILTTAPH